MSKREEEKVFTTLDDLPEIDFENEGPQYPDGESA